MTRGLAPGLVDVPGVRVIAGTARGRRLTAPPGRRIRPTGDRVREALFTMLESLVGVEGARVADLCCGTGALGIEALSRGAASVTFVDRDPRSLQATADNLEATGFGALGTATSRAVSLVRADVVGWARRAEAGSLDLALADPPYRWDGWDELLDALAGRAEVVALESDHHLQVHPPWEVLRERRHGGTVVTVLRAGQGPSS